MSSTNVKMTRLDQAAFPILLIAVVCSHLAIAEDLIGTVVNVHDGDTITLIDQDKKQTKVRLEWVDAPELKQAYGSASRKHLSMLVAGKTVIVSWSKKDRYKRTVGKVLVDGNDANLRQVQDGFAWHYVKYAGEQEVKDRNAYAAAERAARGEHKGLWQEAEPIPPWEWRAQSRAGRP